MSQRIQHTFEFEASAIAEAAKNEANYHEDRIKHWQEEFEDSSAIVERTIGAKLHRRAVTGGEQLDVTIDYGDPDAWQRATLAHKKLIAHRLEAERYRSDQMVYETQGDRPYQLDLDDVQHFRLGGQERED